MLCFQTRAAIPKARNRRLDMLNPKDIFAAAALALLFMVLLTLYTIIFQA